MNLARAAVMVTAVLAVVAATPASSQADVIAARSAAGAKFTPNARVLTANIASGSKCNSGNRAHGYNCLTVVNQQIASWHPDAISIDEACKTDKYHFNEMHPHWDSLFVADDRNAPHKCRPGVQHGNFIAAPKLSNRSVTPLANTAHNGRTMYLVCAKASSFKICTVHLPYQDGQSGTRVHTSDIRKIAKTVEGFTGKVAVCGDFNMKPGDPAFGAFKKDHFTETDPADKATTPGGNKLDYVWWHKAKNAHITAVRGRIVKTTAHFDHYVLEGLVKW